MRGWPVLCLLGACGFSAHARSDGGTGGDARDAPLGDVGAPDVPAGQACFGTLAYTRVCYATANIPAGTHAFTAAVTIDTTTSTECTGNVHALQSLPGNPCIIAYDTITFAATAQLEVKGIRPVLFLATGAAGITIASGAVIDASSGNGNQGAAALASCPGVTAANNISGGFGGSFLSVGGSGGIGAGDQSNDVGAPATVLSAPVALHGGCPGGIGGGNDIMTPALGGGAVAFVAHGIMLDGLVAAAGDGGLAPTNDDSGGNGGGAGGLIVIDALAIAGGGELDAKGGGGGEGRGGNPPTSGTPGYFPANRFLESSGGSTATSTGGDGGDGGPRIDIVTPTDTGASGGAGASAAGGGGGGGAAGVVIATSALPIGVTSNPAPQP